jgi:hypothetical protein
MNQNEAFWFTGGDGTLAKPFSKRISDLDGELNWAKNSATPRRGRSKRRLFSPKVYGSAFESSLRIENAQVNLTEEFSLRYERAHIR